MTSGITCQAINFSLAEMGNTLTAWKSGARRHCLGYKNVACVVYLFICSGIAVIFFQYFSCFESLNYQQFTKKREIDIQVPAGVFLVSSVQQPREIKSSLETCKEHVREPFEMGVLVLRHVCGFMSHSHQLPAQKFDPVTNSGKKKEKKIFSFVGLGGRRGEGKERESLGGGEREQVCAQL